MFKIKAIKPNFNGVLVTCNKYPVDYNVGGIIDSSKANTVKEYQTVVAVGPMVRGIEVGDVVFINPKRYAVMKHKPGSLQDGVIKDNPVIGYNFTIIDIEGKPHLYIQDGDIEYVAIGEEVEDDSSLIIPDQRILN